MSETDDKKRNKTKKRKRDGTSTQSKSESKGNDKEVKYSINAKNVADAVARNEVRNKPKDDFNERKRIVQRGYPKRQEMGFYALKYLYHGLLKTLTKTRRDAKTTFFNSIGYLFMDWSAHEECAVKDLAVHLHWTALF